MSDNNRRDVLRGIATTGFAISTIAGSTAAAGATSTSIDFIDRFQDGNIDGWTADRDLPEGSDGEPVDSHVKHTAYGSASGSWGGCVEFGLEGTHDAGTIWLERSFDVDPDTTYDVDLEFAGYNKAESFVDIVSGQLYLGNDNPRSENDIRGRNSDNAVVVSADVHLEDEEWRYYDGSDTFDSDSSGTVWLAFGMDIHWEDPYWTNRFDDVSLTMTPT